MLQYITYPWTIFYGAHSFPSLVAPMSDEEGTLVVAWKSAPLPFSSLAAVTGRSRASKTEGLYGDSSWL